QHALEIGHGDVLRGGVDLGHAVAHVHAGNARSVEHVCVGAAPGLDVGDRVAAAVERLGHQPYRLVRAGEPVALVFRHDPRLELAVGQVGGVGGRVEHRLHLLAEAVAVAAAGLCPHPALRRDDVAGDAAADQADVRRGGVVD